MRLFSDSPGSATPAREKSEKALDVSNVSLEQWLNELKMPEYLVKVRTEERRSGKEGMKKEGKMVACICIIRRVPISEKDIFFAEIAC